MTGPNFAASNPVLPPELFVEEVRAALDHLFDYTFLHNHALTWRLCGESRTDGVARTQHVRAVFLDAIEHLRPQGRSGSDEIRAYAILTYRCIDGMTMDEIAGKLGLSRRQSYREYAKGIEAVAGLVWEVLSPAARLQAVAHAAAQAAVQEAAEDTAQEPGQEPGQEAGQAAAQGAVQEVSQAVAQEAAAAVVGREAMGEPSVQGQPTRLSAAAAEVARLAGRLALAPVDLATILQGVTDLLGPRLEQTGVVLSIPTAGDWPPVVADRALLRQALLNLFSYALDQAGHGGQVTVTCSPVEHDLALWLAACRSEALPGARREGVGVAVAQKLVAAMGGQALMQHAEDGWRCSLLLPAAKRDTVLVVDDNADLTALFQRYAAGHNLNVVGATSGVQALELAQELRPQLIILDLMLSQMDGWEILQRLRRSAETQTTPIVICSVLNEPALAFSMGASDYVTKPINQATLVDVLRRWLVTLHPVV
jgi:CheY-like chemotaxis protein